MQHKLKPKTYSRETRSSRNQSQRKNIQLTNDNPMTKPSEYFPTTVDEYLATVPNDVRKVLQKLRHTIKSIAPEAEERIAYRIPIFRLKRDLVGFSAQTDPQKRLCSFYTMSPTLAKVMKKDLQGYEVSGATIHFTAEKLLREELVKKNCACKELSGKARK